MNYKEKIKSIPNLYFKGNRLNPQAIHRSWWEKNNVENLYDLIVDYTKEYDIKFRFRIKIFFMNQKPTCIVCNKPVVFADNKLSDYCSLKECRKIGSKERSKKTMIENYGVEYSTQSNICQDKRKQTCIEKYGTDHPAKSEITKTKNKNTNLEKYGVDHYSKTNEFKDKFKNTNLEKYGVENIFQNEDIKRKIKNTNLEKYGVENIFQNEDIKRKIKNTFTEKHGVQNYNYLHLNTTNINKLFNKDWLKFQNHNLEKSSYQIAENLGVYPSTILNKFKKFDIDYNKKNVTYSENIIIELLNEYNINYIYRDRTILKPNELDFVIPEHNLAIEINGIYWHGFKKGKNSNYHLNKTKECNKNGFQLLHFYDHEVKNKTDLIKSMILNKCKKSHKKIGARTTEFMKINNEEAKQFMNENHLQGGLNSKYNYCLFHKNYGIVAVITLGKSRFNKNKYDYEIYRFANKKYFNVIGSFSKLLNNCFENGKIVSYANRRWSNGNLYEQNNFQFVNETKPNYYYFKNEHIYSREKFQKHKLPNILENFDPNLSEKQNMLNNNWDIIWDCGNLVYYYEKE